MADLSQTPANVVAGANAVKLTGTAGATIAAGQPLYADPADGFKLKPGQADGAAAEANCVGLSLHAAAANQPITYETEGNLNPGATVVVGMVYCVSATAGGIAPYGDLTTGDYVTILGVGTSASNIALKIQVSGVEKP